MQTKLKRENSVFLFGNSVAEKSKWLILQNLIGMNNTEKTKLIKNAR